MRMLNVCNMFLEDSSSQENSLFLMKKIDRRATFIWVK